MLRMRKTHSEPRVQETGALCFFRARLSMPEHIHGCAGDYNQTSRSL